MEIRLVHHMQRVFCLIGSGTLRFTEYFLLGTFREAVQNLFILNDGK